MNILVTGANGQLGNEIRRMTEGSCHRFVFTDVDAAESQCLASADRLSTSCLDITDPAAVLRMVSELQPDIVINCAAYTNVDGAEGDAATAELVNSTAAGYIAAAAKAVGAVLIHISTDYVFDGRAAAPYRETDPASPLNVYGRTKLGGEKSIIESGCKYLIFRTSWLYSPYRNNFVKTIRSLCTARDSLRVVIDQVACPTYAADLAALLCRILDEGMYDRTGIYHFTNGGECSRYALAVAVRDLCGNGPDEPAGHFCEVTPCLSDDYPHNAERPAYSALDTAKVRSEFGVDIPRWQDSLKVCLARMRQME